MFNKKTSLVFLFLSLFCSNVFAFSIPTPIKTSCSIASQKKASILLLSAILKQKKSSLVTQKKDISDLQTKMRIHRKKEKDINKMIADFTKAFKDLEKQGKEKKKQGKKDDSLAGKLIIGLILGASLKTIREMKAEMQKMLSEARQKYSKYKPDYAYYQSAYKKLQTLYAEYKKNKKICLRWTFNKKSAFLKGNLHSHCSETQEKEESLLTECLDSQCNPAQQFQQTQQNLRNNSISGIMGGLSFEGNFSERDLLSANQNFIDRCTQAEQKMLQAKQQLGM